MILLLTSFFISFIFTGFIIKSSYLHLQYTKDCPASGPQKLHSHQVIRVGGLAIFIGLASSLFIAVGLDRPVENGLTYLFSLLPVFTIGIAEDVKKNIGVKTRMIVISCAAILATYLLQIEIARINIPYFDRLLNTPLVGLLFAVFAITGLSNAYNIIDGLNGLASMIGIITLLALGYISFSLNDGQLLYLSLIMSSAILGFFAWNYPRGLIFLGDGGAYIIGFWIALITISLVYRHDTVSPWVGIVLNIYPVLETIFTIYRRKIHRGKNPMIADGIHFHTLFFRRVIRPIHSNDLYANSKTSPYLWMLSIITAVPCLFFWRNSLALVMCCILFICLYLWVYMRIVRFKTPRWIIFF